MCIRDSLYLTICLWAEQLLSCQGSLTVAIPAVHLAYRYKGNYCTAWIMLSAQSASGWWLRWFIPWWHRPTGMAGWILICHLCFCGFGAGAGTFVAFRRLMRYHENWNWPSWKRGMLLVRRARRWAWQNAEQSINLRISEWKNLGKMVCCGKKSRF